MRIVHAAVLASLIVLGAPAGAFVAPPTGGAEALAAATGLPLQEPAARTLPLGELVRLADARLGVTRDPAGLAALDLLDPALASVAADLLWAVLDAGAERDAAFAAVSDAEIRALADVETLTPEAASVLARVDVDRLRTASIRLARAVELATPALRALAPPPGPPGAPLAAAPLVDVFPVLGIDPLGVDNAFPHDYLLSIDLGGNDVYDNNAGGSILFGRGFILGDPATFGPAIPFTGLRMGGEYEDAAESYTATVAIDVAGDDTYGVYKTPSPHFTSKDKLCTSELIIRRIVVQGSGSGGIGQLYDLSGNDRYRGKTLAQANGHVTGVGLLVDASGDDSYTAIRSAQGSSVLQGVGVLLDHGGNDAYEMRAPAGGIWNVDRGRCDAGQRLAMGASVIQGASLFLDAAGDDSYRVDSQALGHIDAGQAVATFLDLGGTDDYRAFPGRGDGVESVRTANLGAIPAGAAIFKDV